MFLDLVTSSYAQHGSVVKDIYVLEGLLTKNLMNSHHEPCWNLSGRLESSMSNETGRIRSLPLDKADISVEIVAAIFGVTGAGFKLSLILNALSCEITNAPSEVHAISKSLTLFSLLLKQTAAVFEQDQSVHSQHATRTVEQILLEGNAVLMEINAMLDKVRTKRKDGTVSPSVTQRLQSCFKKHAIEYLLARLDRLQMSLSLILQIMQLGATMASTSRRDSPERVAEMTDRIRRERVEAQNVAALYFFENQKVDQLYVTAREEETSVEMMASRTSDVSDALKLKQSEDQEHQEIDALAVLEHSHGNVQKPARVLPEFEDSWRNMDRSPEDMFKASDEIITRLLDRWTVWRDRRDQELQQPRKTSRYRAAVQDEYDDDELPSARDVDNNDSPPGKYLEGVTTDWRQPHSVEAMQNRARLRKAYSGYQPSVEGQSDKEGSPGSQGSGKKVSRSHVINSDSSSEDDERPKPRRRSSATAVPQGSRKVDEVTSKSYTANTSRTPQRPPRPQISPQYSHSHYQQPVQSRPMSTPDQNISHHSFSTPPPAQYTHHPTLSPSQYTTPNMQSYPFPPSQSSRYVPRPTTQPSRSGQPVRPSSRDGPVRPVSRDGRLARSPSRLSKEYTASDYKEYEMERKKMKKEFKKDIGDKAAKGLLAGGGLAVLLEALDAFS